MRMKWWLGYSALALSGGIALFGARQAHADTIQYDAFWQSDFASGENGWKFNGAVIASSQGQNGVQLHPAANMTCEIVDTDGGKVAYDQGKQLCGGTDPYAAGQFMGHNYYNGKSFFFGNLTSPIVETRQPVTTIVPSWNALTPPGTWVQTHICVRVQGKWSRWYAFPTWASDFSTVKRHSIEGQEDAIGGVDTDTFSTKGGLVTAYQLRVTLFTEHPATTPTILRIAAIASHSGDTKPTIPSDSSVWGKKLAVPARSQMLAEYKGLPYGGGGPVWCSPTSTSMVMAYWGAKLQRRELDKSVPDTARDVYDFVYDGTGVWPYNTAYAGSYGLHAVVSRFYSMTQIEQWIKADVPVVISIAYQPGELPGSPLPQSNGHLLVVRGFTSAGDPIVNDPAQPDNQKVETTYQRSDLERVWLKYSEGTVYLIYPQGLSLPEQHRMENW